MDPSAEFRRLFPEQVRTFPVATSRQPIFCTYSAKPTEGFANPSATSSLLSTPQSRVSQCTTGDPFIANSRLMIVPPRLRRVYAGLEPSDVGGVDDDDDEDPEAYVAPPMNRSDKDRVSHFLDEVCNSPQMDEIESETRKIRHDAQAVLKRLNESWKKKPVRLSSVYFPDLAYTPSSSTYSSATYVPSSSYTSVGRKSVEREVTPELDDSLFRPIRRTYTPYTYGLRTLSHDPGAEAQAEMTRRTIQSENCRKLNDSIRGVVRRQKSPEVESVRNNIEIRAQYALQRAAAKEK